MKPLFLICYFTIFLTSCASTNYTSNKINRDTASKIKITGVNTNLSDTNPNFIFNTIKKNSPEYSEYVSTTSDSKEVNISALITIKFDTKDNTIHFLIEKINSLRFMRKKRLGYLIENESIQPALSHMKEGAKDGDTFFVEMKGKQVDRGKIVALDHTLHLYYISPTHMTWPRFHSEEE